MRNIFIIALVLVSLFGHAQQLARIDKIMGKGVFWFNEPVKPYDVVFNFASNYNNNPCPVLSSIINSIMDCAVREAGLQGKLFDAVIIGNGARDIAIKFKSDTSDNSLARMKPLNGKYAFIFSTPSSNYDNVDQIKVFGYDGVWSPVCMTPNQRAEKVLSESKKKIEKDKLNFDGIILGNDAMHEIILLRR